MKDDSQKDTVILSGVSKPILVNQPFTSCITIQNNAGMDLEIIALTFRYKEGLENCLIDIQTPNQKNDPIVLGECCLGGIGSSYKNPSYARFHIPGKKPVISTGQSLVVNVRTYGQAIEARDINLLIDGQALK